MAKKNEIAADFTASAKIRTPEALGALLRKYRQEKNMTQLDIAGLANTGNRFIGELEKGKPTVQLHLVLKILDLLGLEVVIQRKGN